MLVRAAPTREIAALIEYLHRNNGGDMLVALLSGGKGHHEALRACAILCIRSALAQPMMD